MSEQPNTVDTLYLDAEHFVLTAESQTLEQRERVLPIGRPFAELRETTRQQILAAYDLPTELTDAWEANHMENTGLVHPAGSEETT